MTVVTKCLDIDIVPTAGAFGTVMFLAMVPLQLACTN